MWNVLILKIVLCFVMLSAGLISCNPKDETKAEVSVQKSTAENKAEFLDVMQTHLDAVTNRDLEILRSTLSPKGNMQLILPSEEIIDKVEGFMDYHKEWFAQTDWTFETKILNTAVGETMGMAITEVVYREPERDGKPYFNRMIISYDLQKIEGRWYIIKDHASSVEKSTDSKTY
ncbi:YybH family protein [Maribacter halichondriae]|uniref:YybH family protein n=1 Tax=Maribacter halichondriae TaxID=2980554 RepID=UPI0023593920|nr:nuclear transport factor 2 family protein [Maribacter sp. Hal144]